MSGRMRERVVLQRASEAANGFGEPIKTWTTLAQVWAEVEWVPGSEGVTGEREYAEVPVTVRVRRSSDTMSLREKDRVLVPMGATKLQETIATTADTSVVVNDAGVFPPENEFCVRIASELLLVSAVASNTLTATRGSFGTTAGKYAAGMAVIHMVPLDIVSVAPSPKRGMFDVTAVRSEVRTTA